MAASLAHKLGDIYRTEDIEIEENICFSGLLLPEKILQGLNCAGFVRPSPIQLKAIPLGRCGLDLIVQAKSGTGKTCVYTVIALESLLPESLAVQVLILTPTREIAVQVAHVIGLLGNAFPKLRCYAFIGGMKLSDDKTKLQNCQIVVGTPGRIKQLIGKGMLRTESIRLFVLDEADKLLERNFQEDMNWIYSSLPTNKQMIAASATYPRELAQFLTKYMRNPTFVCLNADDPALRGVKQYYKTVAFHPVSHVLFNNKVGSVIQILNSISFSQCLIFTNYQIKAEALCSHLGSIGWPAIYISGCMDQQQRLKALASLQQFQCRILVSTDLSSRGIDAEHVNLVINFDVPWDLETYFHRIGRAGRFGTVGIAISLTSGETEDEMFHKIKAEGQLNIIALPETIDDTIWTLDKQRNIASNVHAVEVHSDEKVESQKLSMINDKHLQTTVKHKNESKIIDQPSNLICDEHNLLTDKNTEVSQYVGGNKNNTAIVNLNDLSDEKTPTEKVKLNKGFINGNYKSPELQDNAVGNIEEKFSILEVSKDSEQTCELIIEDIEQNDSQEMVINKMPADSLTSCDESSNASSVTIEIMPNEFSQVNNEIVIQTSTENEIKIGSDLSNDTETCELSSQTFADTIKEFLPAMEQIQDLTLPKKLFTSQSINDVVSKLLDRESAKKQSQTFELMYYKDVVAKLQTLKIADEAAQNNPSGSKISALEGDNHFSKDEDCSPVIYAVRKNCDETKLPRNMLEKVTKNLIDSYESMNSRLNIISDKLTQFAEEKQKNILAKFDIDSASSETESAISDDEKQLDLVIVKDEASKLKYIDQNLTKIKTSSVPAEITFGSRNESTEITILDSCNKLHSSSLRINSDIITEHNYSKPNYNENNDKGNLKTELNKKVAASLDYSVQDSKYWKREPNNIKTSGYDIIKERDDILDSSLDLTEILYNDSNQLMEKCNDKTGKLFHSKNASVYVENLFDDTEQEKQKLLSKRMDMKLSHANTSAESKKLSAISENQNPKLNQNSTFNCGVKTNSVKDRYLPFSPIIQVANKQNTNASLGFHAQIRNTDESSTEEDEDSDSEYSDKSDYNINKNLNMTTFSSDYTTPVHHTRLETAQSDKMKHKGGVYTSLSKDDPLIIKECSNPLLDTKGPVSAEKPVNGANNNTVRERSAKMKTSHLRDYDARAAGDTFDNDGYNTTSAKQKPNLSNEAVVNAWHSYWQKWQEVVHLASSASNQDDQDNTSAATTSSHDNHQSAHSQAKHSTRMPRNKSRFPKSVSESEEDYDCGRNKYEKYAHQWKKYWENINKYFASYQGTRICRHKHASQKKRCHSHRPCCHSETQSFPYMYNTSYPYYNYQNVYGVSAPYQYPCSCMYSWLHYKQYLDYVDYVKSMYRY